MASLKHLVFILSLFLFALGIISANNNAISSNTSLLEEEKELKAKIANENKGTTIRAVGESVHIDLCKYQCNNNEEYDYFEKYVCVCHENYIGDFCDQCKPNFYGINCKTCPSADGKICSGNGICDDGMTGTGECYCSSPEFLSKNFCKKVIVDAGHHQENEVKTLGLTFLFFLMLACIILMHVYQKISCLHIIPESILAVIIGFCFGLSIKSYLRNENLINILSFEPHAFFLLLLPPIMYEAGFSLNKGNFFSNIIPIGSYAIFGTIISSIVFSIIIYLPGYFYSLYPLTLSECLQFGSLISAVDPVATLSIFKNFGINKDIFFLVFGESIMNDAVSIALNHSFAVYTQSEFTSDQLSTMLFQFLFIFFGSILFGALVGLFVSLILKYLQFDNDQFIELSFFFFFSYIPYIFSEAIGLSGILSILFTGMVMGHYAKYSLSPISRITVESVLKVISSIAEIFIFAYLGISFPLISVKTPPTLVIIGSVGLLASRAIAIFLISMICNYFSKEKIKFSHQIIVWFSGLRGAVAFYLAINTTSENQSEILSSTLWLILISIVFLGLATPVLLKILDRCYEQENIFLILNKTIYFNVI